MSETALTSSEVGPDDDRAHLAEAVRSWTRIVAWVLSVGGAIGFVAAFVLVQGVLAFFSGNATIAVPAILAAIAVVGAIICANSRDALAYVSPGSAAARR